MSEEMPPPKVMINTNTYVSLGLIALVAGGLLAIMNGLAGAKEEVREARRELTSQVTEARRDLGAKFDKMDMRVSGLESNKNIMTTTDFFKWAVHLQQANPTIKVPEPEVNDK